MLATFYLDEPDPEALGRLDPGHDWRALQRGEHAWILQTYLHLAQAGCDVRLANRPPGSGILVYHAKQRDAVRQHRGQLSEVVLIEVCGDLRARGDSAFQVVQNAGSADGTWRFFLPHWPQPGLLARDQSRGTTLRRVAYKGFDSNLDPYLRSSDWLDFLAGNGLEWIVDSVPYAGESTAGESLEWPDYREVDLLVAARPRGDRRVCRKPATKLYNAWLAGVPAVLGPDVAFRELRRSELDYVEISRPEEAPAAVLRLRDDADLYRAIVANGRQRSADYGVAATVGRWVEFLAETVPAELRARRSATAPHRWVRRAQRALRLA